MCLLANKRIISASINMQNAAIQSAQDQATVRVGSFL